MIDTQFLNALSGFSKIKFNFIPYITEDHGFLTATIISEKSKGLNDKDFFICGPPVMMKALRKQLRDKGVLNYKIHSEEFSMS